MISNKKILFLGSFFPENINDSIVENSKGVIQNAGNTFQKALISGLIKNKFCDYLVVAPLIGSFPRRYKKVWFRGGMDRFKEMPVHVASFLNVPIVKNFTRYWSVKKKLKELILNDINIGVIIIFSLDYSLLRAVFELKKNNKKLKVCLIVTDLVDFMVFPNSIFSNYFRDTLKTQIDKYIAAVDSYVLLTKYMADYLKITNKSFTIVEGIYDDNINGLEIISKFDKPTILYTGTLAKIYGIEHLLRSFTLIDDEQYCLIICGEGDAKEIVEDYCRKDKRIKFLGQLPRSEVLELQKKATVLVNPRFSTDEFTKYSFASKTMEYLASGTPVIMHNLQCLDDNYRNHIYIAFDESDEGLKNKILEVCTLSKKQVLKSAQYAFDFIINEKNGDVQSKKIISLINNEE